VSTTATKVKERPILFSAPMVRAILSGAKTQTRRIVKFKNSAFTFPHSVFKSAFEHPGGGWVFSDGPQRPDWDPAEPSGVPCPLGCIGDRLWVRETCEDNRFVGAGAAKSGELRALCVLVRGMRRKLSGRRIPSKFMGYPVYVGFVEHS
jgi:hypothetical protein